MKTKIFLLSLVFILFNGALHAQDLSGIPGAFVDIGFGAKPVAMGGAFVGLANDVNSIIWNPAGLSYIQKKQVSFTYTNQLGLIDYQYLAAALPISKKDQSSLGFAVIASGDEAMREWTFQSSYGRELYGFLVGASIKLRYATFGNNKLSQNDFALFEPDEISDGLANQVKGDAIGFGFDVGALYKFTEKITVGILLKDIYAPLFWNSENESAINKPKGSYDELIPFEAVFGSALNPIEQLTITADYSPAVYEDGINKFRGGVEGNLFNVLYLRGGFQQYLNDLDDEKYALGVGLKIGDNDLRFFFDYTYLLEELANTQRISISLEF
ncbi:MAG: hypothetical protein KJ799_18230 [Bacteroidetes bacterium]|nr:hypothetical protein [Bacteroidota bacterium]